MQVQLSGLALVIVASPLRAQFNDRWASFVAAPDAIAAAAPISSDDFETDLDWGDLDLDGDADLVVVRKQPFTTLGKRPNVLLLNEGGVLTDVTATLAASSTLGGDQGFLTPTNDRDVVLADLTGDGFLEVITAADQGQNEPKHLSHPRVYLNLGDDGGGAWLGLRHEDARIPQLLHADSGIPLAPRLCAVDAGDFDQDGFVDLYFGDNDTGPVLFGQLEPPEEDSNDRLLVNDGFGYFSDGSAAAMTPAMLESGFCNSVAIADFNQDGTLDVLKQATYSGADARIAYNDPGNPGVFVYQPVILDQTPYFVNAGDLNGDGRIDVAVTQNDPDKFLVNTGNDVFGAATFAAPQDFELLVGSKVGFTYSSNNQIVDLDDDGWGEILIADVDPEIQQYQPGKRTRIYHNRGGVDGESFGAASFTMREERASASDDHWVGVDGISADDLRWTHDIGVFDVDGDGRLDLVLSRREGTQVWRQVAAPTCQESLGYGDGLPVLELCGGDLSSGSDATLRLFGADAGSLAFLIAGLAENPLFLPSFAITVVPNPTLFVLGLATDGSGELSVGIPGGGGPLTIVGQAVTADPGLTEFATSNAISAEFLP